ncbi:MAG: terminase large subunit domain-containing protein [Pseudomonadota bacterium]
MWDLSCTDWQTRIRERRSLLPDLPLIKEEADFAVGFYNEMQLPDVPGTPKLRTASGEWFRDIIRAAFGSWDESAQLRYIRDILAMVPKGSSKTTNSAALSLTAMLMNRRPRGEAVLLGPTQKTALRAFDQAVGMIELSQDLRRRFVPHDYNKTIDDLVTGSVLSVQTFDTKIQTGGIPFFVLIDELHLLGTNVHAAKVIRQIRGGLEKTPEGLLLMITTQSDEQPQGVWREELLMARRIRDGEMRGKPHRAMLPMLWEFPPDIAADKEKWQNPANWSMVMPSIGRPIKLESLVLDWQSEREKGEQSIKIWASQHLNIEIGVGIGGWRAAEYWEDAEDETLTLETLFERSEVVTIGLDGGGLDDLTGMAVIGREKGTRHFLVWCHAWADRGVLEVRKDIAPALRDFVEEGSLTLCRVVKQQARSDQAAAASAAEAAAAIMSPPAGISEDATEAAQLIARVMETGLLPDENAIAIDPNKASAFFEAMFAVGVTPKMIYRVNQQGDTISRGMYNVERKLADGTMWHAPQLLMNWVMGNARIEPRGNNPRVTKAISGRAKIDPLIAMLQGAVAMSFDPQPRNIDISDFLRNAVMV